MNTPALCGCVWMDDIQLVRICPRVARTRLILKGHSITACTDCEDLHKTLRGDERSDKGLRLVGKYFAACPTGTPTVLHVGDSRRLTAAEWMHWGPVPSWATPYWIDK